jgi:hypothetical protein
MEVRDRRGQYAVGTGGGPGRPRRQTEITYLQTFTEHLSLADWGAVIDRAILDAKAGDHKARAWLAAYAMGIPTYNAPRPFDACVEAEAGVDTVANAALFKKLQGLS